MKQEGMFKNNPTFTKDIISPTTESKVSSPTFKSNKMQVGNCSALNFRQKPNGDPVKVKPLLKVGEVVTVKRAIDDTWSKVITKDGIEGCVMSEFLVEG